MFYELPSKILLIIIPYLTNNNSPNHYLGVDLGRLKLYKFCACDVVTTLSCAILPCCLKHSKPNH